MAGDYQWTGVFTCWSAKLAIQIGIICENVKKTDRDEGGELTEIRRKNIGQALGCVVYLIRDVAAYCGSNIGMVAHMNIEKLASRADRGKLKTSS